MAPGGLIGRAGQLPWHEPEDLKHFKRTTLGHAVIMGRKTFESIGRPLPGRTNIVVSRSMSSIEGVTVVGDVESALGQCRVRGVEKAFIIGGAQLYAAALAVVDELIVTEINRPDVTGDTYFPAWDREAWLVVNRSAAGPWDVVTYRRVGGQYSPGKPGG